MKNLKLIALALVISISTASFATATKENPTSKLREQIVELLGAPSEKIADKKIQAEVVFTINNENEIVIISVKSNNQNVKSFVKTKLNNKKVTIKALNEEKIYHMPLTIVNE